ncbi:dihydrofolate reductase [Aquibacillus albus]|uniref:Dihydrofolate reductase n=1 Tax=Aquibacillus albus TaxID=1168171 RepID=A0ABS2MVR4_9BACI|nr:dihydrofolate reductase [Aquibacillus albus]MBM7569883.1 dihydrofolate reductase [Aquibacillus albus]
MISLLVAMDRNRVIGYKNDLPWRLPKDLKFFKELTTNNVIIMGRKTFDSIKRPLPNRKNVIVTRDPSYSQENCTVIHSLETVLEWNRQHPTVEYFIIGGGEIFKQALAVADRMYVTYIDEDFPGDTYFPTYDESEWIETNRVKGIKDEKNPYDYYFIQYDRK